MNKFAGSSRPMRLMHFPDSTRVRRQYGKGIGSFLSRLGKFFMPLVSRSFHALKPIAKKTAKEIGSEAVKLGADVLTDVALGDKNLKESLKEQGKKRVESAKEMVKRRLKEGGSAVLDSINSQGGRGRGKRGGGQQRGGKKRRPMQPLLPSSPFNKKPKKKSLPSIFD